MTHERRLIKKAEAHPLTPSIVSEAVLVDRAHDGDEQALTMLWFRFLPGLEAAVQAITHQRQDTEEILQDAFIRIMNGMETFEAGHAFFPWARKVCTNVALQRKAPAYVRRTSLSADIPGHVAGRTREVAPSSVDFYRNPEELAARNEGRELARAALPELTDYERGIAEMYYFNNMSAQDVADHLDVKVDTIKKHLVHIRKQVAAITQERGRLRRQAYEANQRTRPNAPLEQETEDQEMPIEHVIGALEDDREKDVARMRFVEKLPFLAIAKEL
ncbi:MAG: sigma-70 family RNA polymerase sigma factor, partial [Candidatus Kerfeldbacteria bacterium]|nr:sigma-70 family RNA polymerase sigma factor [Candidatus Kerfeldbacteria bacterium]